MNKPAKFKALPSPPANAIPPASAHVVASIKALHAGTASPHQQQTALEWVIREAGGKGTSFPYHQSERDTAFALGRYFVADLIVGLINAELSSLRRPTDAET